MLPKVIYRFHAILTEILTFLTKIDTKKKNPQVCMRPEKTLNHQRNPEQKE